MLNISTGVTRRYVLQQKLGEGGMGEVYAALDRLTGTPIALKRVLHKPQHLHFNSYSASDDKDDLRRALADEFRILASLRHPHIISVLDYGFDAEQFPYYTMTLLPESRDILVGSQDFTLAQRFKAFAQMLQALAYLHRHGILHRDLKPANVLMDPQNAVKLVDFGLATQDAGYGTTGTLAYMAPEIIQQATASPQSDLYAVGMLAYEMFTGAYPFPASDVNELLQALLHQMPDMRALPDNLQPIITRLLMKDPADRYGDAEAVLTDLVTATEGRLTVEDATVRESFLQAARFVGRDTELTLLRQSLDHIVASDAASSTGAAYLVGGESGAGKSRLLEELRTHALLNGALVLRGQCVAGNGLPFHMWRSVVRRLLLEQPISDLEAGILREIVPDIDVLLERDIPYVPELGAQSAQSRLVETITSVFQRQTTPIVLVLEDLQWALESIIPLKRLLTIVPHQRLLIVGSYRNEEAISLPNQLPSMKIISLGRLSADEIADLTEAMIGSSGRQEHLVDYLHQQSEGNVFFLVEVMRVLADDAGNLRSIGSRTLPRQVFAGGIQRVIEQRLSRLPVEALPTLRIAAVAGRLLDLDLITALMGAEAEMWLRAALEAAILDIVDDQWRFAHDKLRDAILQTLEEIELPAYHRRVAEGLEQLYPNDASRAAILYGHWLAAQEPEKAAAYGVRVTQRRLQMGILNEAQAMLDQVLALNPQDPDVLLTLYDLAGEIAYDLGKPQVSSDYYAASLELAKTLHRLDVAGAALEGMANAAYSLGQYHQAEQWYFESLTLRRTIGDERGAASALHFMSILYRFWGNYEQSRACLDESLMLRRKINDSRGLADSLYQLSVNARNLGQFRQGIVYLEEGRTLRMAIGDKRGLADDLNSLGLCYMLVEEFDLAEATMLECLMIRRSVNNLRGAASILNALSDLEVMRQRYVQALRYSSQALSIWTNFQEKWNIANSHAAQGLVQLLLNERHSARYNLIEALRIARQVNGSFVLLKALIGWVKLLLLEDQPNQAAMFLGLLDTHSAMTAQLRQVHLAPLLATMPMSVYPSEYALGKEFDLNSVVDRILLDESRDLA